MILKNILLGFLIVSAVLAAYVIHTGIAVLHVKTPDVHLWIPVPVALGHLAGNFVKLPLAKASQWEKFREHRKDIIDIVRQLKEVPDADLVEVTNAKEHVRIFKRADALHVHVETPREQVKVRLPLRSVERLIETLSQSPANVGTLVACLEQQPSGDLVHVKTDREEVRVSIW